MEFKEKKNHYLHPDFEDVDINSSKKPSPLALLVQTCKNIGSIKSSKDICYQNKTFSPNSTTNGFRKFSKRYRSDSSSDNSSLDKEYLTPTKRSRVENKIGRKRADEIIERKYSDSSSETSYNSNSSLFNNLLNFVKTSNNTQLGGNDKLDLLNFLTDQYNEKEKKTDILKTRDYPNKGNHFNVEKGYHLETTEESKSFRSRPIYSPLDNQGAKVPVDISLNTFDNDNNNITTSAIKYCMYCGKLIPVLPMLLAHIRSEHNTSNIPDPNTSFNSSFNSNMYDIFSKINPYLASNESKPNQTFSFLTDYFSSSFQGLNNLIC